MGFLTEHLARSSVNRRSISQKERLTRSVYPVSVFFRRNLSNMEFILKLSSSEQMIFGSAE